MHEGGAGNPQGRAKKSHVLCVHLCQEISWFCPPPPEKNPWAAPVEQVNFRLFCIFYSVKEKDLAIKMYLSNLSLYCHTIDIVWLWENNMFPTPTENYADFKFSTQEVK